VSPSYADVQVAPDVASLGVFKPNRDAPIHRWVHLTEGFSAKLVAQALDGVDRDAFVYDPFGGTGTTPLVAAELGFASAWSEVNPYLREAASVKVDAACATLDRRHEIVAALQRALSSGPHLLDEDEHPLTRANAARDFFDLDVARELLGWTRRFESIDGLARRIGLLAVATCAISVSNMKRAVDLRRRTPAELARFKPQAHAAVRARAQLMIDDLLRTPVADGSATCIGSDARSVPPDVDSIDLVVTSPPYLNGTNYCRNTKLELLLLGLIDNEDELKLIRSESVTAGINNVSKRIRAPQTIEAVEAVARRLDECTYDPRIPTMVRAYFSDMQIVFRATREAASDDARMVLDIGDSRFAGVYVDTPGLLSALAERVGWEVQDVEIIRARVAKDGSPLCQKLLRLYSA
jgi:hypothetical protein